MQSEITLKIRENVPLAPLTTFKVGGPARFFVEVSSADELKKALDFAADSGLDVFILGGGSNLLVSDDGFDGIVIRIASKGIRTEESDERQLITVQAGEDWDSFVAYCVNKGLAGVECLSGIPGSVGGTPVQNVGAYGQEVSETIVKVQCLDRSTNKLVELSNEECGFSYRRSIFNSTLRDRYVVVSATFALIPNGRPKIEYRDLRDHFAGRQPSLSETREAVLAIRRAKSMVIDEDDPNTKCAGSFFKNPVISTEQFSRIRESNSAVPQFSAGEGFVKVPAAWLIEKAGFHKGTILGRAGTSTKHSLALINRGGAKAADIIALKELIVSGVESRFGIELQPEPIFVGFRT